MINKLEPKPPVVPVVESIVVEPFKNSMILSSSQRQTLINWLKSTPDFPNNDAKLLSRASGNGWAASNFHSCCDNKGPTFAVIKSGNNIFGGYTEQNWQSSSSHKRAQNSFLFSLVNPRGLSPFKMPLRSGQDGCAMVCNRE